MVSWSRRGIATSWRQAAARLVCHVAAVAAVARRPDAPRAAKVVAFTVLAYALSPLDLVPDFIPVLGLLDDLLLLPLGVWLVVRLVPGPLWQECLARARMPAVRPAAAYLVAAAIMALWLGCMGFLWWRLGGAGTVS